MTPNPLQLVDYRGRMLTIECEDEPWREGGEGRIYRSKDRRHVIKLYQADVDKSPQVLTEIMNVRPQDENPVSKCLAWPWAYVVGTRDRVAGVVTPNMAYDTWMREMIWYQSPNKSRALPSEQRGNFRGRVLAAYDLARAVRYLNFTGFGHADLSGRNCLCNTAEGRGVLIDLDGLVVPKYMEGSVLGTPGYMAPELVTRRKKQPDIKSDRHALAVVLYEFLLMHHPYMNGPRPPLSDDPNLDDLLQSGQQALYKEHPQDTTNRPKRAFPSAELLGREMAELFRQSFVDGMHEPDARPMPADYETALKRLVDDLVPCSRADCLWGYAPSQRHTVTRCPMCGSALETPQPVGYARVLLASRSGFFSTRLNDRVLEVLSSGLTYHDVFRQLGPGGERELVRFEPSEGSGAWQVKKMEGGANCSIYRANHGQPVRVQTGTPQSMYDGDRLWLEFKGQERLIELSQHKKW